MNDRVRPPLYTGLVVTDAIAKGYRTKGCDNESRWRQRFERLKVGNDWGYELDPLK